MKPLKCPNCNSSFSEQYMLNSHIKHVHSEKKLHCMTCDYKTNKNSNLKRHILTHEAKEEPLLKRSNVINVLRYFQTNSILIDMSKMFMVRK